MNRRVAVSVFLSVVAAMFIGMLSVYADSGCCNFVEEYTIISEKPLLPESAEDLLCCELSSGCCLRVSLPCTLNNIISCEFLEKTPYTSVFCVNIIKSIFKPPKM